LFVSLEREKSRGDESGYPPPYLDVFKISKGNRVVSPTVV